VRAACLVIVLLSLMGCSLANPPTPRATYRPISDEILRARIAALAGVTRVELRWSNGFDNANSYGGVVEVGRDVEPIAVLDRVLAILRLGRPGADLGGVRVARPSALDVSATLVGLWSQADYTARYGPQPGTGVPPPTPLIRTR